MNKFPHLNFSEKLKGSPRRGRSNTNSEKSSYNKENRQEHYNELERSMTSVRTDWHEKYLLREEKGLPKLDPDVVPVYLQLNPKVISDDFDLKTFNIEIISEEDDGYIIGASLDNLNALAEKIDLFANEERGGGQVADFWGITEGNQWKPEHILSETLYDRWPNIPDDEEFILDIGIAFDKPVRSEPDPNKQGGERRLEKYNEELLKRDNLFDNRVDDFTDFNGEVDSIIDLEDSFACQVKLNGAGLKDLVLNYPFVFEIVEKDDIESFNGEEEEDLIDDFEILPPESKEVEVAIIDSGVMEKHKFLEPAIISGNSRSYVVGETSTADYVANGGHGTRVAGAILYPLGFSETEAPYQLPFYVRNLRVLDSTNSLKDNYPAALMRTVVEENLDCRIFNMSINSTAPCRTKHMSSWAASIDQLSHDNNILFVLSAGNIRIPQVNHHLALGENYPAYLNNKINRISNPAQSCFSLTVGSINKIKHEDDYFKSLEEEDELSSFSKVGLGIWDMNKPDLVEYGGGFVRTKNPPYLVRSKEETSPELIRSTLNGGGAIGRDLVGTSFSAPKVTHILGELMKLYGNEDVNLLRAIAVQSARLPRDFFYNPTFDSVRFYGYGIPNIERAIDNHPYRITFYDTGEINADEAKIYTVKIPENLRKPEEDHDILIEITLAFTSNVRRTRQKTKSYLATWLDWKSSKKGEELEGFKDFTLKEFNGEPIPSYEKERRNAMPSWEWKIKNQKNHGEVDGVRRSNGSLQKDWCIGSSHDLPEELNFAIRGHKSWDRNQEEIPFAIVVSFESLESSVEVYESIRIENELEISIEQ